MLKRIVMTLTVAVTVAGCAIGNKYDLSQGAAPVAESSRDLAIAVTDMRPYVLSGGKTPTFIGLQRGGFANPFDVNTSSGRALSDDLATMLVNSYAKSGKRPTALSTTPGMETASIVAKTGSTGAERLVVIEVREWKTDVFAQVTVLWDLTARVFDAPGRELATEQSNGVEGTGSAGVGQDANALIAQAAAKRRFGELLSKPAIIAALN